MTTRLGVVIDALVTALTSALPNAEIVDGPALQLPEIGRDTVYIGWSGDEADDISGSATQDWAGLGNRARNEQMSITCRAYSSSGDKTMKPTRDAALVLVAAVETAVRNDPQLSNALTGPSYVRFGEVQRLIQQQTGQGARAGAVFTITGFARL